MGISHAQCQKEYILSKFKAHKYINNFIFKIEKEKNHTVKKVRHTSEILFGIY